jgi:hypothetical protein
VGAHGLVSVAETVLYKRSTTTAQSAHFSSLSRDANPMVEAAGSMDVAKDSSPSREQIEIELLRRENASLRDELDQLRAGWDETLEQVEARALATATQVHVTNDAERLAELRGMLEKVRSAFDEALGQQSMSLANKLAQDALSRLVEVRDDETEWLMRMIERRLGELRSETVVELRLAEDVAPALLMRLREQLPPGAVIVGDSGLRAGSAQIGLRLGRVEIDPSRGFRQLLSVLEQVSAEQGQFDV